MTKRFLLIITTLFSAWNLSAQCPLQNTAFNPGEELNYQLYFNWKFIWLKAGTANLSITADKYNGKDALRCHLITRGSKRTDQFFMMRDTLLGYMTPSTIARAPSKASATTSIRCGTPTLPPAR